MSADAAFISDVTRAIREAGDDHFYGSWSGGAKGAGGRPSTGGGFTPAKNKAEATKRLGEMAGDVDLGPLTTNDANVVLERMEHLRDLGAPRIGSLSFEREDTFLNGSAIHGGNTLGSGQAAHITVSKLPAARQRALNRLTSADDIGGIVAHEYGHALIEATDGPVGPALKVVMNGIPAAKRSAISPYAEQALSGALAQAHERTIGSQRVRINTNGEVMAELFGRMTSKSYVRGTIPNDDVFFRALKAHGATQGNPRGWYKGGTRALPAGVSLSDLYPEGTP